VLHEVLSGKPAFSAENAVDLALAHLTATATAPSVAAPRGWVTKELDELTAKLLDKTPGGRPKGVVAVLEIIEPASKAKAESKKSISEEDLNDKVDALLADPSDGAAALALESTVEQAFQIAADSMEECEDEASKFKAKEFKKALLFRAARIYESTLEDAGKAEDVYAQIVALDPEDEIAFTALEELRRAIGKHEELIEMLLDRSEK